MGKKKNILLIDDDKNVLDTLKCKFKNCTIDFFENPVHFLDFVYEKKQDLNQYDIIFSDYNFDNIGMNAAELNLSRYIRKSGFNNYLILISIQLYFDWRHVENEEFFDEVILKEEIPSLNIILKRCARSLFRPLWQERI